MDKICYIYAGVNGAGKTTLYNMNQDKDLGIRINIDEILHDSKGDWKNDDDQRKATAKAFDLLQECLKEGKTFNYETVFTGDIDSFLQKIKNSGYRIHVHYIGLDNYSIAIERIKNRENKGGHSIPKEDVIRRYTESLNNLKRAIELCDRVFIYDNTTKMKRIALCMDRKISYILEKCVWFENLIKQ